MSRLIKFSEALVLMQGDNADKNQLKDAVVVVGNHRRLNKLGHNVPWSHDDAKGVSDADIGDVLQKSFEVDYAKPLTTCMVNIVLSIMERFPNSCLSSNYSPMDVFICNIDDLHFWSEEVLDFFRYEILPFCGCGAIEETEIIFHRVLKSIDIKDISLKEMPNEVGRVYAEHDQRLAGINGAFVQTILYVLDNCRLVAHGSSIGGSWLTNFGRAYLFALENSSTVK